MKYKLIRLAFSALTLILIFQNVYSQDTIVGQIPSEKMSRSKVLEFLISTNRDVRLNAVIDLNEQRKQLVQRLMIILNSTNSNEMKMDAVVVLGEYRSAEAVPFLVSHLDWESNMRANVKPLPFSFGVTRNEEIEVNMEPVTSALFKIGLPAIPALQDKIAETDDTNAIAQCVRTCTAIEGREVTQFRLQRFLDKETDPKRKGRIQFALDALKKLNPEK